MVLDTRSVTVPAAVASIAGSIIMLIGAALWATSGTDLWMALDQGDIAGYLMASGSVKPQLVTNLTVWIIGVLVLGFAGSIMADLSKETPAYSHAAELCYRTAVPMVIVSYVIMMVLVVRISPETSATAAAIADVVGWIGARIDDISTALMIGLGPFFISLGGRGQWVPPWLRLWSYLAALLGLLSMVVLYFSGLVELGFLVIPVGVGWMIAAGIVLLKKD